MPIYPSSTTAVDGTTITENAAGEIAVKQSVITQASTISDITYSSDTTLTADVYANNLTIDSGITLTTAGYNIYCVGTFTNSGTVITGASTGGGGGSSGNGTSFTSSYGGSGGGGGGNGGSSGGNGGATLASGGAGEVGNGNAGSTPSTPTLTSSLINSWYIKGMSNFLNGGGGGGGYGTSGGPGGGGGNLGFGIYIQANKIVAGSITSSGQAGIAGSSSNTPSGGGGGGGGTILLAYGSGGYTAGTYTTSGGGGGAASDSTGGTGGNGSVMTFSGIPILISSFSYTTNTDSIRNRNSSFQYALTSTTATSPTSVISQSLTPKTTGLIAIRVLAKIYNSTVGDGVDIYLYNGTTEIDSDSYTQEGLASNPHLTALYYEAQYTTGTQQTFSVQFNAITGGTASCEIQEFTIEEIY
jgi:hypothetical protein